MDEANEYKKYTRQAKTGIKGEAFFESLVSDCSIPHRVTGPKDIGVDYICEWVYGDRPTGVLYTVQVKTFSGASNQPKAVGMANLNGLRVFRISNSNLQVGPKTRYYWRKLGLPAYLFAIHRMGANLDCYYKRFSAILTKEQAEKEYDEDPYGGFFKVNHGSDFHAFGDLDSGEGGFARDLFIDHVRWSYHKGSIVFPDPTDLGLRGFDSEAVFIDIFEEYRDRIARTFSRTAQYLQMRGQISEEGAVFSDSWELPQDQRLSLMGQTSASDAPIKRIECVELNAEPRTGSSEDNTEDEESI